MADPVARPQVSVLGAGSWGTALAALAASQTQTWLWARDASVVSNIQRQHQHPRYLHGITLPATIHATHDFHAAVVHALSRKPSLTPASVQTAPGAAAGLVILGVPVAGLDDICARLAALLQTQPKHADPALQPAIIWTCKGVHPENYTLPHHIVEQYFAGLSLGLGVLSGPSFAHEVAQGLPLALTIASSQTWVADRVVAALHGSNARIYSSTDVIGVELGGALKNVIAIACGIADGLGLGENARAALITRGLAEIQRLGLALGGQAQTFSGLTGVGDLVLSATGQSRNRQVGLDIASGQALTQILSRAMTAEGVRCARAVQALGRQYAVDTPITDAVCQVLFDGIAPPQAVAALLAREARTEGMAHLHSP